MDKSLNSTPSLNFNIQSPDEEAEKNNAPACENEVNLKLVKIENFAGDPKRQRFEEDGAKSLRLEADQERAFSAVSTGSYPELSDSTNTNRDDETTITNLSGQEGATTPHGLSSSILYSAPLCESMETNQTSQGNSENEIPHKSSNQEFELPTLPPAQSKTLRLRGYQTEVCQRACSGENDIIILPTGTGKTYVAIKIIQEHFTSRHSGEGAPLAGVTGRNVEAAGEDVDSDEDNTAVGQQSAAITNTNTSNHISGAAENEKDPLHKRDSVVTRVCFIVPTTPLASQQLDKIQQYITLDRVHSEKIIYLIWKCIIYLISTSSKVQSGDSFILVLTPAILENYLNKEVASIADFSLLIFDECHHAKDKHPYNVLLKKYFDYVTKHPDGPKPPQLVGMTASIGIGTSNTLSSSVNFMTKMCARFHLAHAPTEVVRYMSELENSTNTPEEDYRFVPSRRTDGFTNLVEKILMLKMEQLSLYKAKEISRKLGAQSCQWTMQFHQNRQSQAYEQQVIKFKKEVESISEDLIREEAHFIIIALDHLLVCYKTVQLVNLLQSVHGVNYLKDLENTEPALQGIDQLWQQLQGSVKILAEKKDEPNQKLVMLKAELEKLFSKNSESKVIIFVKMRVVAKYLAEWLCEAHPSFRAHEFTSPGRSEKEGGSQRSQLVDAKLGFEGDKYNILVATSVLEEGIDVQACNMVVRYMYSSDLISKIQGRGRARAENSKILYILDDVLHMQERRLFHKQKLMVEALKEIRGFPKDEFQRKIQNEKRLPTLFPAPVKPSTHVAVNPQPDAVVSCRKCSNKLGLVDDIRSLEPENSFHIVLDKTVAEKVIPFPNTDFMRKPINNCFPLGALNCKYKTRDGKPCYNQVGNLITIKEAGASYALWLITGIKFNSRSYTKYKHVKRDFLIRPIKMEELLEVVEETSFSEEALNELRRYTEPV